MGEESTLDLALEDNLRITTYARVAYFGDDYVGMRFTDRVDRTVLGQYRSWLEGQQRLQAHAGPGKLRVRGRRPPRSARRRCPRCASGWTGTPPS